MTLLTSAIDFGSCYTSSFRLMRVDPATWADAGELDGFDSASVNRDGSDDLLESGSIMLNRGLAQRTEFYARIEMMAESGAARERHALATLLVTPGPRTSTSGGADAELVGRSVLAPADDRVLLAGTYAPMGCDGAAYAAGLLRECIPAPVSVQGSFKLSEPVVFAAGTTYLEAAWMLLDRAGWVRTIDGRGCVTICPMPLEPALVLSKARAGILGAEVLDDPVGDGTVKIPNRIVVADPENDRRAVAVDMTDNPTSYKTIGRYVDVYEESPTLVDGETLQAYANRRLVEETSVGGTRKYPRAWWPGVHPFSLVRGSMADVGLDGDMRVLSQALEIDAGVNVSEVAEVLR